MFAYIINTEIYEKSESGFIRKMFKRKSENKINVLGKTVNEYFKPVGKIINVEIIRDDEQLMKKFESDLLNILYANDIEFVCCDAIRNINVNFGIPYTYGYYAFFSYCISYLKQKINFNKDIVGIVADEESDIEIIGKMCLSFPNVYLFCENKKIAEKIAKNIYENEGISMFCPSDNKIIFDCRAIFNLSLHINVCEEKDCEFIFSVQKGRAGDISKIYFDNLRVLDNIFINDKFIENKFTMGYVEGMLRSDKKVRENIDILEIDIKEYLKEKKYKIIY